LGRKKGWAGGELGCGVEERRGERGIGKVLFFLTFVLNLFKLSNYKLFSKFKHFKPFASFEIIF
jgi:hypothetical protein